MAAVAAAAAAAGGAGAAAGAAVAVGGEAPIVAVPTADAPRGSLLFGFGGAAAAEAAAAVRLAEHRALVDAEHLRLEYAMAAMDAAGARTRRHWRRISRLAEAEALIGEWEEDGEERIGDGADCREGNSSGGDGGQRAVKRAANGAGGERLTGLHRNCQWKLAGNEHEGSEPGRFRPVLQPVVAAAQGSRYLALAQQNMSSSFSSSSGALSMEDVGLQLARKCSRYIVDIVKTEADGEGLADTAAAVSGGEGMDGDDDVWGVIGPVTPAGITPSEANSAANAAAAAGANTSPGDATRYGNQDDMESSLGIVEEVSSTGDTPAARAKREEEERRLVEERVRQATAAVANRGGVPVEAGGRRGSAAGPQVDLGPGAGRWRRAVAVAAEAIGSGTGVSEMVVLVTPKGNIRGRLSLVDKVRR